MQRRAEGGLGLPRLWIGLRCWLFEAPAVMGKRRDPPRRGKIVSRSTGLGVGQAAPICGWHVAGADWPARGRRHALAMSSVGCRRNSGRWRCDNLMPARVLADDIEPRAKET